MPSSGVILEHLEFNFLKPGVLYIIKQVRCWMVRALLMYNLVNVIKVCVISLVNIIYFTSLTAAVDLEESKRATIVVGFSHVT